MIDLDRYLARIGYAGPRDATLEVLKALHFAHSTSIPFENLDVLARRPIRLDPASLQKKLIEDRRGGYCFELNGLFLAALRAMGFEVTPFIGRVRWMQPEDIATARTHMLMRVDLPEGPYIADVGFGGLTMTGPIRFVCDLEQATPHEPRRLLARSDGYELQGKLGEAWVSIYHFTEEVQSPADYELSSWYTSTHPDSLFVQHLIAARPFADRRVTLFNTNLAIRGLNGQVESHKLETVADIAQALREHLGLPLSAEEQTVMLAPYMDAWLALQAG